MAGSFTIIAEGASGSDKDFEYDLAKAVGGEVEPEGKMLGGVEAAADLFRFLVENKEAIAAALTISGLALKIVDQLIDLAVKWNTKLTVSHGGKSASVDAPNREAAAAVVEGALKRGA